MVPTPQASFLSTGLTRGFIPRYLVSGAAGLDSDPMPQTRVQNKLVRLRLRLGLRSAGRNGHHRHF